MNTAVSFRNCCLAAIYSLLACVTIVCVSGVCVFSQETQTSQTKQSASVTPAAIAVLVGQMEQLGDSLALGKTDATVRNASEAVLARLDSLIELQRQAEKNAKAQNDPNKKDSDKQGKPGSQDDKTQDEQNKSEDGNNTAAQNVSAQSASGQAPSGEGFFYGKGKGTVQAKSFTSSGDWGALPPEKRQQAMQTINEKFPPQYRILIEQYFRKIAEEP